MRHMLAAISLGIILMVTACSAEDEVDALAASGDLSPSELRELAELKERQNARDAKDQAIIDRAVDAVGGGVPAAGIVGLIGGAVWQGVRRDSAFRNWLRRRTPQPGAAA